MLTPGQTRSNDADRSALSPRLDVDAPRDRARVAARRSVRHVDPPARRHISGLGDRQLFRDRAHRGSLAQRRSDVPSPLLPPPATGRLQADPRGGSDHRCGHRTGASDRVADTLPKTSGGVSPPALGSCSFGPAYPGRPGSPRVHRRQGTHRGVPGGWCSSPAAEERG